MSKHKQLRIGIYAGAFDPVHSGHISFALQAIEAAKLDEVIFLPERRPRFKPGVEHFAHRLSMLKLAIRPHAKLSVAELPDKQFTVHRTMSRLRQKLPRNVQFVLLTGLDVAAMIPTWPHAADLLSECELIVSIRDAKLHHSTENIISGWPVQPKRLMVVDSYSPHVSSTAIRVALRHNKKVAAGLLSSVRQYAKRQWLYVSLNR